MNAELKFKIDHSHKNIVNLESSEESYKSSVGSDFFNQVKDLDEDQMTCPQKNLALRSLNSLHAGSGPGLAPRITYHNQKKEEIEKFIHQEIKNHLLHVNNALEERRALKER